MFIKDLLLCVFFPVQGGNKQRIQQGSVAAVRATGKATVCGSLRGVDAVTGGDLTEVLLGCMTPEQADENHNPCLIKNNKRKKKLQYGFKIHTRQTRDATPPPSTTQYSLAGLWFD